MKSPKSKVSIEWGVGRQRRECGSLFFLVEVFIAAVAVLRLPTVDALIWLFFNHGSLKPCSI
nr:MAG TPA: hypothetical protein [Bacteriophage sp.]